MEEPTVTKEKPIVKLTSPKSPRTGEARMPVKAVGLQKKVEGKRKRRGLVQKLKRFNRYDKHRSKQKSQNVQEVDPDL